MRSWQSVLILSLSLIVSLTSTQSPFSTAMAGLTRPKLVLVLVIDQFRADYLTRFEKQFLPPHGKGGKPGGFRYLMSKSAYFPSAQYDYLQSITAPGHTTIATGGYPYLTGITANEWFNPKLQRLEYCVEDPSSALVQSPWVEGPANETSGRSPKNLNGSTLSDEIKNTHPGSRVVTVSLKDRSAILLGGKRADLALWFDGATRTWASSKYYLGNQKLPNWVNELNRETTRALEPQTPSVAPSVEVRPTSDLDSDETYRAKGTQLTALAATQAMHAYGLGKGPQTDYLAVSFSTHDIVGHHLGPNSNEMEKLTLIEDQTLAELLNSVRLWVPGGLENVLIAFTADHGVAPSSDWAKANRLDSGRIDERDLREKIGARLNEKFGKPKNGNWLATSMVMNFYLNHSAIQEKGLTAKTVEDETKKVLLEENGIQFVFTRTEHKERKLPPNMLERQILRTYHATHSGDVVAILRPFYLTLKKELAPSVTSHVTGYSYDRTVPLMIAGKYVKPGIYASRAEIVDLAPTLAFLLGTLPPVLSEGRVLSEALQF